MFAFHGYGQTRTVFSELTRCFPEYTIYAFDLFFHGESNWEESDTIMSPAFIQEFIAGFALRNNIQRFSLLGFSIGARVVLAAIPLFSSMIDHVWLLAPHGVKSDYLYKFATRSGIGTRLFRGMLSQSGWLFCLFDLMARSGIADRKLLRFAKSRLRTEAGRKRVYNTWMLYSALDKPWKEVVAVLNTSGIRLIVVLGASDFLFKPDYFESRLKDVINKEIMTLESSHERLIYDMIETLS